ncbi:MAG: SulP family inorganic anion transporter [Chloroflexi bacterium]|nr:SulP family inorganic anion transporter [Chloroflexota bacterium]MCY3696507.1 SulP family inorganic anion transporter [Chloroflexota bacterium]
MRVVMSPTGRPLRPSLRLRPPGYGLDDLRGDLIGGLLAGVTSIPFAMGFGILSGLGPVAGMYGSIGLALTSAIVGGGRGILKTPALAVSMILAQYSDSAIEAVAIGVLAGVIQMVFAALGLGRYIAYLPHSVLTGFFSGLGILLLVSQLGHAIGIELTTSGVVPVVDEAIGQIGNRNGDAVALTLISLAIALAWRGRIASKLPSALIILILGTLLGAIWFGAAPPVPSLTIEPPGLQFAGLTADLFVEIIEPAILVALLNTLVALTGAIKCDLVSGSDHHPNRFTFGLGLGTVAVSSLGGLPGGIGPASFVYTYNGGRTAVGCVAVLLVVIAAVTVLEGVIQQIPLAIISFIMIATAWQMVDWRFLRCIPRMEKSYAFSMVATMLCTVFVSFVDAVLVGAILTLMLNSRRDERHELAGLISVPLLDVVLFRGSEISRRDPYDAHCGLIVLPERVTAASARQLKLSLRPDLEGHRIAILDASRTRVIDDSGATMIAELLRVGQQSGRLVVIVASLAPNVGRMLRGLIELNDAPDTHFAANTEAAYEIARSEVLKLDRFAQSNGAREA